MAIILGFVLVWACGPRVIRVLVRLKIGDQPEFDHEALNQLTKSKKNTPTMGGILIVGAIFVTHAAAGRPHQFLRQDGPVLSCVGWAFWAASMIGLKLTAGRRAGTRDGLRLWEKLIFQVGLGALLAVVHPADG